MDVEVWSNLLEELLMRVLSHLPTIIMIKFKVVSKSRRTEFRQSIKCPSLFVPWFSYRSYHTDYFKDIETATPSFFYSICNPITRTCKRLPPAIQLRSEMHFIAMSFDTFARRCLLVIGVNNNTGGHRNQLVMEIFDSESSTWTKLEMDMPLSICPNREGVYSRGSFYWINYTPLDQSRPTVFRYDVVAFNVREKRWDVIKRPQTAIDIPEFEYKCCWKLTGYDGKVVLVDQIDMSLWKLNIELCDKPSWSELQAFPKSPYEERVSCGNKGRANGHPNVTRAYPRIVINSCGWVLVHIPLKQLVIFDAEGRMVRSIEGKLVRVFELAGWRFPLHAYEINNVWWP
ncbi:hypothetical protein SUGI_0474020 [Cryptomeria japonica]|nr:hypothetical protein SUGI_0474020 [Cryptomeria japonica]